MASTQACIFDLDRTLVDLQSYTDYGAALRELLQLLGGAQPAEVPAADWEAPTLTTMAILVGLAGDERWQAASDVVARYEHEAIPHSVAMPGLAELDSQLQGLPRAVVTLLPTDVARAALAHHGITIDVVIGRDPHIRAKPSGAGLVIAAQQLGVNIGDCVMIGDSSWDHAAAMDAGAGFVGVPVSAMAFPSDVPIARDLTEAVRRALSKS
jgi:phosphoglycolate phosphatase-like HAD superfamily hydrolase